MHLLADVSDRTDIFPLWNSFLKWTAAVIPCQKCQKHMGEYWTQHVFMPKGWNQLTAAQTRAVIRQKVSDFHNAVNVRLGKPVVPLTPLPEKGVNREAICLELRDLFRGLKNEWSAAHIEWKRTTALLLQLCSCCGM
jgi:hypothetical protein